MRLTVESKHSGILFRDCLVNLLLLLQTGPLPRLLSTVSRFSKQRSSIAVRLHFPFSPFCLPNQIFPFFGSGH